MGSFFTGVSRKSLDVDGVDSDKRGTEFESDSERHIDSDDEAFASDTAVSNNCDCPALDLVVLRLRRPFFFFKVLLPHRRQSHLDAGTPSGMLS